MLRPLLLLIRNREMEARIYSLRTRVSQCTCCFPKSGQARRGRVWEDVQRCVPGHRGE
jgi:hypothetical protein